MLTSSVPNTSKYNPAFDGLRAVAVTLVIAFHLYPDAVPGGWIGVDIFFALSGYLITSLLVRELSGTGSVSLKRFYLRRFMRLMPPLWTVLIAIVPVAIVASHSADLFKSWLMAATYMMNINRAFSIWPDFLLGHTWSLAAEEQFYLLWPLAILVLRDRDTIFKACLLLIALVVFWRTSLILSSAPPQRIYNGFDTHLDPIIFGCGLAVFEISDKAREYISKLWPIWIAVVLFLALTLQYTSLRSQALGFPTTGMIGCFLIIAAGATGAFKKLLSLKPIVFTGKISYALYLWHYPILSFANQKFHLKGLSSVIPILIAYAISSASYFTLEAYFRAWKGRGRYRGNEDLVCASAPQ